MNIDYLRTEAAKVLEDAVEIRNELEKAEEAQKNAEEAIETAREDITQADIYLKQVKHCELINRINELKTLLNRN